MWYGKTFLKHFFFSPCLPLFAGDWTKCQNNPPGECRADGGESLLELKPLDSMGVQEACTKRLKGTEQKSKKLYTSQPRYSLWCAFLWKRRAWSKVWGWLSTSWMFFYSPWLPDAEVRTTKRGKFWFAVVGPVTAWLHCHSPPQKTYNISIRQNSQWIFNTAMGAGNNAGPMGTFVSAKEKDSVYVVKRRFGLEDVCARWPIWIVILKALRVLFVNWKILKSIGMTVATKSSHCEMAYIFNALWPNAFYVSIELTSCSIARFASLFSGNPSTFSSHFSCFGWYNHIFFFLNLSENC